MTVAQDSKTSQQQQQHLQSMIQTFNQRTAKSKQFAQSNRAILADKSSIGFNFTPTTKEICYPIVVARSEGSKLWDIDGREYIDILMGLGAHLCGHNPPFIRAAIAQQLESGIAIGPQSPLVGEVARLLCDLTGMERVTLSNTGTEAVMTAIRIARAATGRRKLQFLQIPTTVTWMQRWCARPSASTPRKPLTGC